MKWQVGEMEVDEMEKWWKGKLMKWQVDEMASWWNGKMMNWQVDEVASWWKLQVDEVAS